MSTGNRCNIYDKIDALAGIRTVPELTRKLIEILNELAYYTVTGDGAVMEAREEWHQRYTDILRAEEARPDPVQASGPSAPKPRRAAAAAAPKPKAPPPRQEDLPDSLRMIMEGRHSSFAADD